MACHANESDQIEEKREKDSVWAIVAFLPLAVILGLHIGMIACFVRDRFRVPYVVTSLSLLIAEMGIVASGLERFRGGLGLVAFGGILVFAAIMHLPNGWKGLIEPTNIEQVVPAHMLLVILAALSMIF